MTDISALFHQAGAGEGAPSPEVIEADLLRGRQALAQHHRRRTIRRSLVMTTSLAAVGAVAVVLSQSTPTDAPPVTAHPGVTRPVAPSGIQLVSYTGKQLAGFTVDRVPAGWQLSNSTQYALLITPVGSTDHRPDAFEGKLAVLTSSLDAHGLGDGRPVTVNGRPGRVMDQGPYGLTLRYNDSAHGFGVDIQAPLALHWTDAQVIAFAEGVHVTGDAVHSRG
ncbi:MAG: hypothetical protein JWM40_2901 [Frankiales bacterium]|nr:hypothetical protein [Frankiales bacterium]